MRVLLVLSLVLAVILGDTCFSVPPSFAPGANCNTNTQATPCKTGYYCSTSGVCAAQVAAAGACDSTIPNQCAAGTQCQGPTGNQICVAFAGPGESCSTNLTDTVPFCGTGLSCAGTYGYCFGGTIGDACYNSSDCAFVSFGSFLNCTNSVCQPIPIGGFCNPGQIPTFCGTNAYCSPFTDTCTAFLAPGAICSSGQCGPGYYCVGEYAADTSPVCVQNQTKTVGQYCSGQNEVCQTSRYCQNNYCAKQSPNWCQFSCSANQVCACNGLALNGGFSNTYGQCITNPCYSALETLMTCLNSYCDGSLQTASQAISYKTSCVNTNCLTQYANYMACSSSLRLVPGFFLIIALFGLVSRLI